MVENFSATNLESYFWDGKSEFAVERESRSFKLDMGKGH